MNRHILLSLLLLLTICSTTTNTASQQPWRFYILPCRHTEAGVLQCLTAKNNNWPVLIKNNFTGPVMVPGSTKNINFDAIRNSAHQEIQKLGFTKTDYIYTIGEGDPNFRTVYHVFLIDPRKAVNPSETTWEDLASVSPKLGLHREFIEDIKNGVKNRYQRKTIFVDWDETAGTGFVKQANSITPQRSYEKTMYTLAADSNRPYLLTTTAIRPVGKDNATNPEDDTAFERYEIALAPTPVSSASLLFPTKNPEAAAPIVAHWTSRETMELAQRILDAVGERALNLFTQALYDLSQNETRAI